MMGKTWGRLNREEKLIIALLNGEYEGAVELFKSKPYFGYDHFIDLLIHHRIAPFVLSRLLTHLSPFLSDEIKKHARLSLLQQKTVNKLHRDELIRAAALLSDKGFDVTLMKGLSYDPEEKRTRTYGDVDLLIEEEKIREVVSVLEEAGYTYKGSFILSREEKKDIEGQLSWNNQYQFLSPHSPQTIEIHTNLFERDRIRLENLKTLLDRPDLFKRNRQWHEEFHCFLPSQEASLMLLCLHCSLKRSFSNNKFILRHMTDMEMLFDRGIRGNEFLTLCKESQTEIHAVFSLKLYSLIRNRPLPAWYDALEKDLTPKERFLIRRHLACMKNMRRSCFLGRLFYNYTAPFIIGENGRQRYTWIRNNILATKVAQENRYYRWGFKKESPLIYLTYLLNPFQTFWGFIKKLMNIKDNSSPE